MPAPDITNSDIFEPVEAYIRTEEHTDSSLFRFVAALAESAPPFAAAFSRHIADIIDEMGADDLTYSDIMVHAYWRTYFSPEHAGKYGTDELAHDRAKLQHFASYLIDPSSVDPANVPSTPHAPLTIH